LGPAASSGEQHSETANIHPTTRPRSFFSSAVAAIAGSRIACTTALLTVRGGGLERRSIVKDML
jgi:hypothetical protein